MYFYRELLCNLHSLCEIPDNQVQFNNAPLQLAQLSSIYICENQVIQSLLKIKQIEIKHCMAFSGGPSITEVAVFLASSVANNSLFWGWGWGILGVCTFNKVNNFQANELVLKRKQDTCIAVRGLDVVIANSALGLIFFKT